MKVRSMKLHTSLRITWCLPHCKEQTHGVGRSVSPACLSKATSELGVTLRGLGGLWRAKEVPYVQAAGSV